MENKSYYKSSILWLFYAAVIFAFDRVVKLYILSNFRIGTVFGGIPFIADFVYVQNTGAAFSILSNDTAVLSIISVVFCIAAIAYWIIKRPQHNLIKTAIMMLLSGALGNAVDRIKYGYVVDFIDIKWFEFPIFNIADMAIVLGAIVLVIYVMFFEDREKAGEKKDE